MNLSEIYLDISLLAEVENQEVEAVEEIIHEAVNARLVRSGQYGLFIFSHDKIRETLYAEVSDLRCQRLHKALFLSPYSYSLPSRR